MMNLEKSENTREAALHGRAAPDGALREIVVGVL
jgi:hypothetical protein